MRMARRYGIILVSMLVVLIGILYLDIAFTTDSQRRIAPLDDAYITFQYARPIARGHPYQYNDGDPPTTGMTSPLFGFLLAGAYRLGLGDDLLPAFAVGLGIVWLASIAWLTYGLASRWLDEKARTLWPLLAALLVVLTGAVQWGCFNGMETGVFAVLTLGALNAFFAGRTGWCALWLSLAGLTRPEGQLLAGLLWVVALVGGIRTRPAGWKGCLWILSIPVLVGFVPMGVNWGLTGTTSAAGLQAKSWLLNVPFDLGDIAHSIWLSFRRLVFERFMGWGAWGLWFVSPGLLLLMLPGGVGLAVHRSWQALAIAFGWFLGGLLVIATLITASWHLGRYQVPLIPVAIVLSVCGLAFLWSRAARRWQRVLLASVVLWMLGTSVVSTFHFVGLYRRAVSTVARQQLVLSDWMREHLPQDAHVGVHDTGMLRYLGERPTYDLIGLTTAGATVPWRHGSGSVFEWMEHSPSRPDYFGIYPDVFSIPYLAETDLFAEELFRVEVPDYAIASAGPTQGVWRADWRLAGSGTPLYQPDILAHTASMTMVDAIDVADLDDEGAHNVIWWHEVRRPGFPTEVRQLAYRVLPERQVLDGGRLVTGGISSDVTTRPGESLWLVARLHAHEAGSVRVEVDGQGVGSWAYPPVPGQWLETMFHVPAWAVTGERTHVELRVEADSPGFLHYAPYAFWFLQGEPEETSVEVEHPVDAAFAGDLSLLGYMVPAQAWRPGDVVPITLYWQAAAPAQTDAKVFLHLYDAEGKLGPQSDGWAYYGTRPPYTWRSQEIVTDPRVLALPADLPPGRYSLEVGLYTPGDALRLPAHLDGIRQREGRVPLTMIDVVE